MVVLVEINALRWICITNGVII